MINPRGGTFNWPPPGTATWPLTDTGLQRDDHCEGIDTWFSLLLRTYCGCVDVARPADRGQKETAVVLFDRNSSLPAQLTSFLGREGELRQLTSALAKSRLVTVTGAGGGEPVGALLLSQQDS